MINNHFSNKCGFTLLEILAAVAIIAVLLTVMVPQVANFVATAQRESDKRTLTVLNDALNRYKTQGGDVNALTLGAPIANVLARLQTPINWNGMVHQVMKLGETYPARSISVLGSQKTYRFVNYNTFSTDPNGIKYPHLNTKEAGLAARWAFEEGSGTTATDSSGNGYNGTWTGTAVGTSGYYSAGREGNWAGTFNGSNVAVTAPAIPALFNSTSMTICGWVYPPNMPATHMQYFGVRTNTEGAFYTLQFAGTNSLEARFTNSSNQAFNNGGTLTPNQWNHIALTYNGATVRTYINGNLTESQAASGTIITPQSFYIGSYGGYAGWWFSGLIDDVRVYSRALSAGEVGELLKQ